LHIYILDLANHNRANIYSAMANQFDKVIKKLNFKGIKLNLCTKKASYDKKLDYEFAPYETQPVEAALSHLDTYESQHPTERISVSAHLQSNKSQFDSNITAFRTIYAQLSSANLNNQAQYLQQRSSSSFSNNQISYNEEVLTDVPIYENNAFSNEDYSSELSSPLQSSVVSKSTSKCSCYNDCSCVESNCSQLNNESYFDIDNEKLYVCCKAYNAKMDGDLSLRFTDRIKLIHQNDDIALVKNILNGKCGYVPRDCITTISEFLSEIQYFN